MNLATLALFDKYFFIVHLLSKDVPWYPIPPELEVTTKNILPHPVCNYITTKTIIKCLCEKSMLFLGTLPSFNNWLHILHCHFHLNIHHEYPNSEFLMQLVMVHVGLRYYPVDVYDNEILAAFLHTIFSWNPSCDTITSL